MAAYSYHVSMTDWVTISSSVATGGGTLVLAVATFASVRSGQRAARVAEEALLAGFRPLLMASRPEDPPVKVGFIDNHMVVTAGGGGTAEITDSAIYLTMSIRNVGSGMAVLHGWRVELANGTSRFDRPPVEAFRRLNRDIYVAPGDVAFWQGAYRDLTEPEVAEISKLITARERVVIDLLYGDHQGGQRVVSRFSLLPRGEDAWFASVARHWNVDRPDPR